MCAVFIFLAGGIFEDHGFIINIINDYIHAAVIIQIGIGGAVWKRRYVKPPTICYIFKLQFTVVPESEIWYFYDRNLIQYLFFGVCKILYWGGLWVKIW